MTECIVFFDIDGTLLSTGGAGQRAMDMALTEDFRVQFPFEGVFTAGRTDRGIADEIFARFGLADTDDERERFMLSYLRRLPDCLSRNGGSLLPGVASLLELLSTREDLVLSLLTGNYAEGAWIKLRHFGIDRYFRPGGFGDTHADRDDVARQAVLAIRDHLGQTNPTTRMVVIGDTPADIRCARAIGATAVAVATGHYSVDDLRQHDPDHLFPDFSATDDVITRLIAL